jgi:hypothetical protein
LRGGILPGSETDKVLEKKIDEFALAMEKMKIAEYVEYLKNTRKMLFVNFVILTLFIQMDREAENLHLPKIWLKKLPNSGHRKKMD